MDLINQLTIPRGDLRYLQFKQDVACLSTDLVGDWVCTRGERVNGKWRVQKADLYDRTKMPAIGVLISKSTPTVGVMQVIGPCTLFTGLDYTQQVAWLGPAGLQYSLPSAGPSGYAIIQRLGKPMASDIFWITGSLEMLERTS